MTTIKATADAPAGTVHLTITPTAPVAAVTRADINGVHPVRTHAGVLPHGGGVLTITDHEAALDGLMEYRVDDGGAGANVWVNIGGGLPRFLLPTSPNYSVAAATVHGYESTMNTRTTVHHVVGRSDPIVIQGALSSRRGRLDIYQADYLSAKNLSTLFKKGRTVLYRQAEHPGMDMFFHPESVVLAPANVDGSRTAWRHTVNYIEVTRPVGNVTTRPSWTFHALAAAEDSFNTTAANYDSFLDLANGEDNTP